MINDIVSDKPVNFRFDKREVLVWDKFGKEQGFNRTELFRTALNEYVQKGHDAIDSATVTRLKSENEMLRKKLDDLHEKREGSAVHKAKDALLHTKELKERLAYIGDISKHPAFVYLRSKGIKIKDVHSERSYRITSLIELMDYYKKYLGL